jgi:hypothetical protein
MQSISELPNSLKINEFLITFDFIRLDLGFLAKACIGMRHGPEAVTP